MTGSEVVNTVLGQIPAGNLGITFSHEHLAMNPGNPARYGDSIFDDTAIIIQEVAEFSAAGGRTIVEMSPLNFGRNVLVYQEISKATGINIICATGFHKEEFIPSWVNTKSNGEMIDLLKSEIYQGISASGIRPGVIKIGTSFNAITDIEKRSIEIASIVQKETFLAINTHCDRGTMALEQCRLFLEFGANPDKVILGHVDIPNDGEYLKKICSLGFNVEIDHVGRDKTNKDIVKITLIKTLIESGFIDRIFLSGDMGKKSYLKSYGGEPGLSYILREFKHNLLENGIGETEIEQILVKNPRRVFSFNPPQVSSDTCS